VPHGSVGLVAGVASRLRRFTPTELAPSTIGHWQQVRKTIRQRFALRAQGRRFRRDPDAYLTQLEDAYFRLTLPV